VEDGSLFKQFLELLQGRTLYPKPFGAETVKFRVALEAAKEHPVKGEQGKEKKCCQGEVQTEDPF
jgi:hypothetical protein